MKAANKMREWRKKKKDYYHIQAGLKWILLGWGICVIFLIGGFALTAVQYADRETRKEKSRVYESMASYVTEQIENNCVFLQRIAAEIADFSEEQRGAYIHAIEGIDGAAVYEQGEVVGYPRNEIMFLKYMETYEGRLEEPVETLQMLMGSSSNSRYHVGDLQMGYIMKSSERNVLVSRTIDLTMDSGCEFYIYIPDSNVVYPQGYLRPDFTAVKEKMKSDMGENIIQIPSYTAYLQESREYGFYGVLCVRDEKLNTGKSGYLTLLLWAMLFLVILLICTYVLFVRKVYSPVIRIENAINGILNGSHGLSVEIDDTSELASTGRAINSMLSHVEELASKEYQSEILKRQAELNALQNQINPHFLYNTLESIRGLALREGSKNAANMTKALANLFRYNIDNRNLTVTLQEEIANINNYFVIQKFRFSNKIRLVIYMDEESPQIRQYQVPHMVLQPIVENAVCHGLETKRGGGTIIIMAMATESRVIITVSDDGLGMDESTLERIEEQLQRGFTSDCCKERTGIALYNVNERIRILYGSDYGIHVHSTKGIGTEVEIVLPLICHEKKS